MEKFGPKVLFGFDDGDYIQYNGWEYQQADDGGTRQVSEHRERLKDVLLNTGQVVGGTDGLAPFWDIHIVRIDELTDEEKGVEGHPQDTEQTNHLTDGKDAVQTIAANGGGFFVFIRIRHYDS